MIRESEENVEEKLEIILVLIYDDDNDGRGTKMKEKRGKKSI